MLTSLIIFISYSVLSSGYRVALISDIHLNMTDDSEYFSCNPTKCYDLAGMPDKDTNTALFRTILDDI